MTSPWNNAPKEPKHSARDDIIALLARREYSASELDDRLRRKGHEAEAIDTALTALQEEGLQSDARFTEHFVRSHVARGQGAIKIASALYQRGIDAAMARQALADSETDWFSLACEVLARRFSDPGHTPAEQAKRLRYLASRGFNGEQSRHALACAFDPSVD